MRWTTSPYVVRISHALRAAAGAEQQPEQLGATRVDELIVRMSRQIALMRKATAQSTSSTSSSTRRRMRRSRHSEDSTQQVVHVPAAKGRECVSQNFLKSILSRIYANHKATRGGRRLHAACGRQQARQTRHSKDTANPRVIKVLAMPGETGSEISCQPSERESRGRRGGGGMEGDRNRE